MTDSKNNAYIEACLNSINEKKETIKRLEARNARLLAALDILCDEVGATELHGDEADNAFCPVCRAYKQAREVIAAEEKEQVK